MSDFFSFDREYERKGGIKGLEAILRSSLNVYESEEIFDHIKPIR